MQPAPTPVPPITRDDILRAEHDLEGARAKWRGAGRLRVSPTDVPDAEAQAQRLAKEWQAIERARLPLDQLDHFEQEARGAKRLTRRLTAALVWLRVRAWGLAYSDFLRRTLGVADQQLWVLSVVNGVWGVLGAAALVVAVGWGVPAFWILAACGYAVAALWSLRPLLRASRSGMSMIRADLDYRATRRRGERDASRLKVSQLTTRCRELRDAIATREQLSEARARVEKLRENAACQAEYERAEGELKRIRRALGDVRYDLLATDWRSLRGIPFEDFLARVFRSLGYDVQKTKTSGDQGVDLIATRNGHRLAIQTKGYAGSVGNDSVQQAHAGKAFYGCDASAVVTNSRFTRSAQELAQRVGCILIDEAAIVPLINGQVV